MKHLLKSNWSKKMTEVSQETKTQEIQKEFLNQLNNVIGIAANKMISEADSPLPLLPVLAASAGQILAVVTVGLSDEQSENATKAFFGGIAHTFAATAQIIIDDQKPAGEADV